MARHISGVIVELTADAVHGSGIPRAPAGQTQKVYVLVVALWGSRSRQLLAEVFRASVCATTTGYKGRRTKAAVVLFD